VEAPPPAVVEGVDAISQQQVRPAIEPMGPSKFRLKSAGGSRELLTVTAPHCIGSRQACSCRGAICVHVLHVMMRYFGVPPENELLFQTHLTDHEIDALLTGALRRRPVPKRHPVRVTPPGRRKVRRLPVGEDDVCPICYDSLADCARATVAWCRAGCGANFHRKCVKLWIDSQRSSGKRPSCPMCRELYHAPRPVAVVGGAAFGADYAAR